MTRVNVKGTANVISACIHHGVEKLIYTSTASVAFDGSDILYKNEQQLGYAHTPVDAYTGTKVRILWLLKEVILCIRQVARNLCWKPMDQEINLQLVH